MLCYHCTIMSGKTKVERPAANAAVSESDALTPEQKKAVDSIRALRKMAVEVRDEMDFAFRCIADSIESAESGKAAMALHQLTNAGDSVVACKQACGRIESRRKKAWSNIKREFINNN